jgi:2-isopropylmalate synthase
VNIEILDTTLRDGVQGEGISFSIDDKIAIVRALDELGIALIEAGNPGSTHTDRTFFQKLKTVHLTASTVCAFGATRKKGITAAEDTALQQLLKAETDTVVIFGKAWDFHVRNVLKVSLSENLSLIYETITFLCEHGRNVIFDAEHFFDAWKDNQTYALSSIQTAFEAGAVRIVLCDTNGGTFPNELSAIINTVLEEAPYMRQCLGIHAHNDTGMACANSIMAVQAGCTHVQGTLLGFGERCGNAPLAVVIPNLALKLNYPCIDPGKLEHLTELSRRIAEIANISIPNTMPYIGKHAFSHKAGMHADGILKNPRSFEHIAPHQIGNNRHFLISEVSGRSIIAERVKAIDPTVTRDSPFIASLISRIKALEAEGWQFEGADASFELLIRRERGLFKCPFFNLLAYRVSSEHPPAEALACSHAWVKVQVDGIAEIAAAEGYGPVHALDGALRKALMRFYPQLEQVRLSDFKVRVIDGTEATAARVRVLIESFSPINSWTTVGVSEDIIDASRAALIDSIDYALFFFEKTTVEEPT